MSRHSLLGKCPAVRNPTPAFSLIEVLFAITFLILVGVAMTSMTNAAARLTEAAELKQMALGLNEQSLSFVALEKRTKGDGFKTTYSAACITPSDPPGQATKTCYVVCPTGISPNCTLQLQKTPASLQIGTSKLQFEPKVVIREAFGTADPNKRYLVNATTSWGKGPQKQLTIARIIE